MITNDKSEICKLGKSVYQSIEEDGFNPCHSCNITYDECQYGQYMRVSGVLCKIKRNIPIDNSTNICQVCGRTTAKAEHIVEYTDRLYTVNKCGICRAEFLRPYKKSKPIRK